MHSNFTFMLAEWVPRAKFTKLCTFGFGLMSKIWLRSYSALTTTSGLWLLSMPPWICMSSISYSFLFLVIRKQIWSECYSRRVFYPIVIRFLHIAFFNYVRRDMQNQSFHYGRPYGQGKLTRYWSKETKPDKETHSHPNSRETWSKKPKSIYWKKVQSHVWLSYCKHNGLTTFLKENSCVFTITPEGNCASIWVTVVQNWYT